MMGKNEQGEAVNKSLLEFDASNYQFIKRVDQQCLLSGNLNKLGRDISFLKNKCRQKLDSSGIQNYENRLRLLKNQIDSIIDTEDSASTSYLNHQNLEKELETELDLLCDKNNKDKNPFLRCSNCQKYVLSDIMILHKKQCCTSTHSPGLLHSSDINYNESPKDVIDETIHAKNKDSVEIVDTNNQETSTTKVEHSSNIYSNECSTTSSIYTSCKNKSEVNILNKNSPIEEPNTPKKLMNLAMKSCYINDKANSRRVSFPDKQELNEARNDHLEYENEHDYTKRRDQYEFRIQAIEEEIILNETIVTEITSSCNYTMLKATNMQKRILILQHEFNRVSSLRVNVKDISSNVIHGSHQSFHTLQQLKNELNLELDKVHIDMANLKRSVIKDNKRKTRVLELIEKKKLQFQERQAAFSSFEAEHRNTKRLRYGFQGKIKGETLRNLFDHWIGIARRKIQIKNMLLKLKRKLFSHLYDAFTNWKTFVNNCNTNVHVESQTNKDKKGLGGFLLRVAERQVLDHLDEFQTLLNEVSDASQQHREVDTFDESLCQMDLCSFLPKNDIGDTISEVSASMIKGDRLTKMKHHHDALQWYNDALKLIPQGAKVSDNGTGDSSDNLFFYVLLYGRMANCELKLNSWNRALYYYEKQYFVVKKTDYCIAAFIPVYLCLAKCYIGLKSFSQGVVWYTKALSVCFDKACCNNDSLSNMVLKRYKILSCNGLSKCYNKLNQFDSAKNYVEMAHKIVNEKKDKIILGIKAMEEMESNIISISATHESLVKLELVTGHMVCLRMEKSKLDSNLFALKKKLSMLHEESNESKIVITKIDQQYNDAASTTKDTFESSLIHTKATQNFEISELLMRLIEKKKIYNSQLLKSEEKEDEIKSEIDSIEESIGGIKDEIRVENGPLMQKILNERRFRCMVQNTSDVFNNEITVGGNKDGGVPYIAASEASDLFVYNIKTGKMECSFLGDTEGSTSNGGPHGHTSVITAIYFSNMRVYTGSMDKYVMCWDIEKNERIFKSSGHEGTVTCISVDDIKMLTGSADKRIGIWDKNTGVLVRFVEGHSRGIICIDSGPNWCLSGGSDGIVFVWDQCTQEVDKEMMLKCKQRLKSKSSEVMITVARYGKLEIVSGDSNGSILVWWIENGEVLQNCKAHEGRVVDLQFDATKIISSGYDSKIQIINILTGTIIQTLSGHDSHVASVSFDSVRVLSLSVDGVLIQWLLGNYDFKDDNTEDKAQLVKARVTKVSRKARNRRKDKGHNGNAHVSTTTEAPPLREDMKESTTAQRSGQCALAGRLPSGCVKEVRFKFNI